jgi:ketosteroid isomerase-like protein
VTIDFYRIIIKRKTSNNGVNADSKKSAADFIRRLLGANAELSFTPNLFPPQVARTNVGAEIPLHGTAAPWLAETNASHFSAPSRGSAQLGIRLLRAVPRFILTRAAQSGAYRRYAISTEANTNVVLSFLDNVSAVKYDAALALLADTATWWVVGKPEEFVMAGTMTKAQFTEGLKGMGEMIPKGLRFSIKGITAEGNRVAVEAESIGETATGKTYNGQYHFLFEVRDGMIQAVREYADTLHAQKVLIDQ